MSRTVAEWIGATDDQAIPARVKVRIFDRCNGRCNECGVAIVGAIRPQFDHVISIINGGANAERNLQLLCQPCHAAKTKCDVAEKAVSYRKRVKFLGLKSPRQKIQSGAFRRSAPQRTASRPIVRKSELPA